MHVVRELTENRSKLVCARTNLAEKLAEMQHEYMRLMRVADLSRVVSKENVAKTAKVMKTLKQVSCYDLLCTVNPLMCSNSPLLPPRPTRYEYWEKSLYLAPKYSCMLD